MDISDVTFTVPNLAHVRIEPTIKPDSSECDGIEWQDEGLEANNLFEHEDNHGVNDDLFDDQRLWVERRNNSEYRLLHALFDDRPHYLLTIQYQQHQHESSIYSI